MRKALLVIAALFTTVQVFAASVTLKVDDIGGNWAAIRYSAIDANVSGFGLKVTADSGAIFTDINDYNVGECTASVQGYGIFPGTIDINESTGKVDNNGTPVAPNDDPGADGTGIDTNTLILEMGALYVEGNEPAQSGTLIKVQVDKICQVCVEGEPIRGNIVLTDGTSVDANDCNTVGEEEKCFYVGLVDQCGHTVTQADVTRWENLGEPDCWCYDCHCWGDHDGDCDVDAGDVYALVDGWNNYNDGYCSDTDYDGDVDAGDVYNLVDGWNDGCGECTPEP